MPARRRPGARRRPAGGHAPRGKVPPNVRGLSRDIAARKERGERLDAGADRDAHGWLRRSPAWAISLSFHLVAAVVLMNVVYFRPHQRLGQIFRVALRIATPGGQQEGPQDNGTKGNESEDSPPAASAAPDPDATADAPLLPLPAPTTGVATANPAPIRVEGTPTAGDGPAFGGIYAGRGGSGRGTALQKYGGDGVSEAAVEAGLEWLAAHQAADGGWEIAGYVKRCPAGKKCEDGRDEWWASQFDAYRCAITGLATLSFLGAGYTHQDDRRTATEDGSPAPRHAYCDVVDRALVWLCRVQRADGSLVSSDRESERCMYSHGMAGIALVEAYSVTHDPRLRAHAQLAVNFTCASQQDNGGWDYGVHRSGRGDTSVVSWQVMLLRSARAAGLAVPKKTWERAKAYMETVTDRAAGSIAYELEGPQQVPQEGCNAMVAAGWVSRAYLGIADDHPTQDRFAAVLRAVPPRASGDWGSCAHWSMLASRKADGHWSLYYNYYGTLAMFHHGGEDWTAWNALIRKATLPSQRKDGHEKGSWDPVTADGSFGGRVYATAMNVINLEVYYRYLPIYEVGADFGLSALAGDADWAALRDRSAKGTFHVRARAPSAGDPKDEDGVDALLADLKSADMMTRRNAARALSQKGLKEAIAPLIAAQAAERTSLRPVLIEYLGAFGPVPEVLDTLIPLLQDGSERIRKAAADALRKATGQDFGVHYLDWQKWRETHAPK